MPGLLASALQSEPALAADRGKEPAHHRKKMGEAAAADTAPGAVGQFTAQEKNQTALASRELANWAARAELPAHHKAAAAFFIVKQGAGLVSATRFWARCRGKVLALVTDCADDGVMNGERI